MIRLTGVSKIFETGNQDITAVSEVSVSIPRGALTLLTGNNGSGKTTLMLLMAGILSPDAGRVYLDGMDISRLPERIRSRIRRNRTGIIFQERFFIRTAPVWQNLVLSLIPTERPMADIRNKGKALLRRFGLEEKENVRCGRLSGGEKQRLAIARALINDPDVIFADEPTTHLDHDVLQMLTREIQNWKTRGKTVVIATHQPELLNAAGPDIRLTLEKGRLAREER